MYMVDVTLCILYVDPNASKLNRIYLMSVYNSGARNICSGATRAPPLLRVRDKGAQGWSNCKCPAVNYLFD